MATPSSGAGIGITGSCRAVSIPTCTTRRRRQPGASTVTFPGRAVAVVGQTKAGPAGVPFDCVSSRTGATTILAFELSPSCHDHASPSRMTSTSQNTPHGEAPIEIVEYDPLWPSKFQAERALLQTVLAPWLTGPIEHVGSTAIP